MDEKEERELIKSIKKTVVTKLAGVITGLFVTSCIGLTVFYFNTQHVTAQNTQHIKELVEAKSKQNNSPQLNTLKINQLSKEIAEHKASTKELSDDLKEFKKQYDADKMVIVKLLMEIKEQSK